MDSRRGNAIQWHRLPVQSLEQMLSSLSVPVLCRLQSVCTSWNELISNHAFHDLYDRNDKSAPLLFLWRKEPQMDCCRPFTTSRVTAMLTFLDVNANRWHSIPAKELPTLFDWDVETRMIAMDNGLVCELNSFYENFSLLLTDPVSNRQRTLPTPPTVYDPKGGFPHIVPVVDNVTHRYKVFLFNNLDAALPRVYVLKSFTDEWRAVHQESSCDGAQDRNRMRRVHDAIGFDNTVVAAEVISEDHGHEEVRLLVYQDGEDSFAQFWRMSFRRIRPNVRLVGTDNRLFVIVVLRPCSGEDFEHRVDDDCLSAESLFQTHQEDREQVFEMYEVLVLENGRQPVVQLREIFGLRVIEDELAESTYGYPCFGSNNGRCDSVVMVHRLSGKVRRYHLKTGSVDVLARHPFRRPAECGVRCSYESKSMKLSLRNVLAQWPWSS